MVDKIRNIDYFRLGSAEIDLLVGIFMDNKKTIEKLYKIGKLPSEEIADKTNFPLKEFDTLLQKIKLPIDFETALKLINLSPPIDEKCYEVESSIIPLVESYLVKNHNVTNDDYKKLLDEAEDGEVKNILKIRFANYLKDNES